MRKELVVIFISILNDRAKQNIQVVKIRKISQYQEINYFFVQLLLLLLVPLQYESRGICVSMKRMNPEADWSVSFASVSKSRQNLMI